MRFLGTSSSELAAVGSLAYQMVQTVSMSRLGNVASCMKLYTLTGSALPLPFTSGAPGAWSAIDGALLFCGLGFGLFGCATDCAGLGVASGSESESETTMYFDQFTGPSIDFVLTGVVEICTETGRKVSAFVLARFALW